MIDPGVVAFPMTTGTPFRNVDALPPMPSTPTREAPLPTGTVSWLFAAKSARGLAPRAIGAPALLSSGHWALENSCQIAEYKKSVSAFARPLAPEVAFPIVRPFAATKPFGTTGENDGTGVPEGSCPGGCTQLAADAASGSVRLLSTVDIQCLPITTAELRI